MEMATVLEETTNFLTIQVKIPLSGSMLKMESGIQEAVNAVGSLATGKALSKFDTDGKPIVVNNERYTVKYRTPEVYQTPYGNVEVERNVYQHSAGGKTYCPMEDHARIVITSTPRFARIISYKYGEMGALKVVRDLQETTGRSVARSFIQNVSEAVGAVLMTKEVTWEYDLPKFSKPVETISVGLDGTTILMCKDEEALLGQGRVGESGYREAMVGTIAFYDKDGERLHTIYTASTPEYGKEVFLSRFDSELENVKKKFPNVHYLGIADGANGNWEFLSSRVDEEILDFYHASEYITKAGDALFSKKPERDHWITSSCHHLKHNTGGASAILNEMKILKESKKLKKEKSEAIETSIVYFTNQLQRMNYPKHVKVDHPIGSGVTEAAAKVVVKQRLCNSGMKWKQEGAAIVLSIRCLSLSGDRWNQAWDKIDQEGFQIAA